MQQRRVKLPKIVHEMRRKKKDDKIFKSALDNIVLKSCAGIAFISLMMSVVAAYYEIRPIIGALIGFVTSAVPVIGPKHLAEALVRIPTAEVMAAKGMAVQDGEAKCGIAFTE